MQLLMNARHILVLLVSVPLLLHASQRFAFRYTSNIVGNVNTVITQGISRISIQLNPLTPFPTLGDAIHLSDPKDVIGDTISFVDDGIRQSYTFVKYDGTNAILRTTQKNLPNDISLHGIPLYPSIEYTHVSARSIILSSAGEVSDGSSKGTIQFDVKYISPIDSKARNLSL